MPAGLDAPFPSFTLPPPALPAPRCSAPPCFYAVPQRCRSPQMQNSVAARQRNCTNFLLESAAPRSFVSLFLTFC
ncbi:protein of unknown function [Cupriavidus taiwanensis]|uniref:Uncharacterized protein n=1 Tax=Cupriavidus taiwanensis TaxID=164546 RepID=A0A7Z7J6M5_9BURK|nr:protein of unknown function [Cupriavidus taiwanensis]SOY99813.1 hypothetical protein CBM2595_A10141 [Cupriavidus taiwanensis]SPC06209.1 hypothetical protein CBM2594_A10171 [Cupriavidus taiwanensis]